MQFEIIYEFCNLGVLREDVDVKSKRILKDNVDVANADDFESSYANLPDSSSRADEPQSRVSENKWLDDSGTSEVEVTEFTSSFILKEDFEKVWIGDFANSLPTQNIISNDSFLKAKQ